MTSFTQTITYWGKTRFGDHSAPPWKLEYREGQGYFAIATRDFKAGDMICIETPTTWCEGWHPFDDNQISDIRMRVDSLDEGPILTRRNSSGISDVNYIVAEKAAFYEMANAFPELDACAGIYMTNSFDMVGASQPSCGMYLVRN
jgi:hypothetical protein